MAIVSSSASSVVANAAAVPWTNPANVYASDNVYATHIGTTQNTEYAFDVGGFNFAGISGFTGAVTVTVEAKTGTAARAQIKVELMDGTTVLATRALANLTAADVNYTLAATITLAQLQSVNLKVRVTNKRIVSQASTTSVDWVKIDATVAGPKVETLTDTFDTQLDSAKWPNQSNAPVWEAGRIKLGATATNYCGFSTGYIYDATNSSVFCKITPPPAGYSREIALGLEASAANNDGASIVIYGGRDAEPIRSIIARRREGNTNYNTAFLPYDPTQHAYVRIRMVGTTQFKYDASPDGINWTEFSSETTALDMTSCKVICQSGQWQTETDSPQYGFIDYVNTVGPAIAKMTTLTDDFATQLDRTRWDVQGTAVWEAGQVKLTMPVQAYSRLWCMEAFDLRESSFLCKITRPATGFDSSEISFRLSSANNVHNVQVYSYVVGGQWYIGTRIRENSSNNDYVNSISFPEVCWWRVRLVGATLYYEYSTDGTAWTPIDSKPCTPNNFAVLRPVFEFGHWQAHGPLTGFLDNVNVSAEAATATGRPKVRIASNWVQKPAKVRIGGAWVEKPVKVRVGGVWKTVT